MHCSLEGAAGLLPHAQHAAAASATGHRRRRRRRHALVRTRRRRPLRASGGGRRPPASAPCAPSGWASCSQEGQRGRASTSAVNPAANAIVAHSTYAARHSAAALRASRPDPKVLRSSTTSSSSRRGGTPPPTHTQTPAPVSDEAVAGLPRERAAVYRTQRRALAVVRVGRAHGAAIDQRRVVPVNLQACRCFVGGVETGSLVCAQRSSGQAAGPRTLCAHCFCKVLHNAQCTPRNRGAARWRGC